MQLLSLITLAAFAAAAPVKEARQAQGPTDADILNYALTLEHLEDTFYRQGLANFTEEHFAEAGYNSTFYKNLMTVSMDESTHVSFLTEALMAANATPVAECTYSFPVTDVQSFLATASVLEGVGVSAYLGAAAQIMSKTYLTAAASILTVESRHSAYIRANQPMPQSPFPQPFDDPLTLNEVYTLASPFIAGCPASNPMLPVKAFPMLTATSMDMPIKQGSTVSLMTAPGVDVVTATPGAPVYGAFITVTGAVTVAATMNAMGGFDVVVPEGVNGQSYVVLTGCNATMVTDDIVAAGPAVLEIANY